MTTRSPVADPVRRTPASDQVPGVPPLRWWMPTVAFVVAAVVLSLLVIAFGTNAGPLDDPKQAYQRDGALHNGSQVGAQVGTVAFGGRTTVVLFERRLPGDAALARWRGDVTRRGTQLVVAVAGQTGTSVLRSAVGMRTPIDAGPPVGYAIVGPDRRVRYATLHPAYLDHASEVDLLIADITGHQS